MYGIPTPKSNHFKSISYFSLFMGISLISLSVYAGGHIFGGHKTKTANVNGVYAIGVHICSSLECPKVRITQGNCTGDNMSKHWGVCVCDKGYVASGDYCDPCPPGYVSDGISDCKPCPSGTYRASENATSCTACPDILATSCADLTGASTACQDGSFLKDEKCHSCPEYFACHKDCETIQEVMNYAKTESEEAYKKSQALYKEASDHALEAESLKEQIKQIRDYDLPKSQECHEREANLSDLKEQEAALLTNKDYYTEKIEEYTSEMIETSARIAEKEAELAAMDCPSAACSALEAEIELLNNMWHKAQANINDAELSLNTTMARLNAVRSNIEYHIAEFQLYCPDSCEPCHTDPKVLEDKIPDLEAKISVEEALYAQVFAESKEYMNVYTDLQKEYEAINETYEANDCVGDCPHAKDSCTTTP